MTDFDLDLDGLDAVRARLDELERDGTSDAVYQVETTADYAGFLEFGTRHMPPYPFFAPAIRDLEASPEAFLAKTTGFGGLGDVESVDELLLAYASGLETQIKRNARAASATGRSPGTHPDHPRVQTGNLVGSTGFRRLR